MPERETVIFIHGLTGNKRAFNHLSKKNDDYKYISYDLLGHGEYAGQAVDFSIDALVQQLEEVYVENGISSAHLCVLSYGCYVGIPFTRKHPHKVKSLTVVGGHYNNPSELYSILHKHSDRVDENYHRWLKTYTNDVFPKSGLLDKTAFVSRKLYIHLGLKLHPTIIKQSLTERMRYDLKYDLQQIKQPILWCMGEHDHLYKSAVYDLQEIVPHVQYKEIKKAGHAANVFQPKSFETIFLSFLKEIEK